MELTIKELIKEYGDVRALDRINITLTSGVYGLLGANGAGKSTLMNLITDNVSRTKGEILYNGKDILDLGNNFRKVLGYMPQQQGFYDNMSAKAFLLYMASLKGISRREARSQTDELLSTVNLSNVKHKKIGEFSGGMKQRLLLAQALLGDPDILLLDEPTAGLDPKERIRIRNFISDIAEDKIVILATHVVSDIEFIAKEVILLKSGKLVACDNIAELLKTVEDKTFEITTEDSLLVRKLQENYRVSNILREGNTVKVRIVTDNLPISVSAVKVKPTLEDLYLYIFEEEKD